MNIDTAASKMRKRDDGEVEAYQKNFNQQEARKKSKKIK